MFAFVTRLAAAGCIAIGLSCALPAPVRAADSIEINALLPMTGPLAFYGTSIAQSLAVQERTINSGGGINGMPIHIVTLDDQANPQTAVQLTTPLVSRGVAVLIDGGPAATCRATTAVVKQNAVVFCLSTAYEPTPDSYSFTTPFSLEASIAAQVRFFRMRGLKRMGFITATDATGQAVEAVLTNVLAYPENRDIVAVGRERFGMTDISVSAQLARIRSGNPQALFAIASGTPLGLLLREIRDAGMTMPVATLASNQSIKQLSGFGAIVPNDLELVSARWSAYDVMHGGPVKVKVSEFLKALGSAGVGTDGPASLAWDPVMLIVDAYRKLGASATPAAINGYIAHLRNVPGICGYYDFIATPGRGLTSKDSVVLRWNAARKTFDPISTAGGSAVLRG